MTNLTIRRSSSIREKVHTAIRNDILDGRLPEGARLVEARLAQEIKTSRTPVREALHLLEQEGLLETIPRVGYRVRRLQWQELEEICEIRVANETLAARWAMDRITEKQLRALEENLDTSEADAIKGNPETFLNYDAEFHEIIAKASGSKRLLELCQLLRRHMLRYRIESLYLPETDFRDMALGAIAGHRRILECIRTKDRQEVEKAIRSHLEETKTAIDRYAFHKEESKARGKV